MKATEGNRQLLQLALHKYIPHVLLFLAPVLVSHVVPGEQGRAIVLNQRWPFARECNPTPCWLVSLGKRNSTGIGHPAAHQTHDPAPSLVPLGCFSPRSRNVTVYLVGKREAGPSVNSHHGNPVYAPDPCQTALQSKQQIPE